MAKASERRLKKVISHLSELLQKSPRDFERVWTIYMAEWVKEIHYRARAQRQDGFEKPIPAIFDVFNKANLIAIAINAKKHVFVQTSLAMLQHESSEAVASCTDIRLYRHRVDCTYRIEMRLARPNKKDSNADKY